MPQIQKIKDLRLLEKMLTSAELHLDRLKNREELEKNKVQFLEDSISEVQLRLEELKSGANNRVSKKEKRTTT